MGALTDSATPPSADAKAHRQAAAHEASNDEKGRDPVGRNKKLAEAWNACKFQFAEDLAGRTSQTSDAILQATFMACSRDEDALRASFLEGKMRPEAVNDTIGRMRQTSRDQIAARILAIRGGKQSGSLANAKRD